MMSLQQYMHLNVHPRASDREVIRRTRAMICDHHRRSPDARERRHHIYRRALALHSQVRKLYDRLG